MIFSGTSFSGNPYEYVSSRNGGRIDNEKTRKENQKSKFLKINKMSINWLLKEL